MKPHSKTKQWTFGELVAGGYRASGKRKANGIIRLALKARLIEFGGQERFVIS